MRTKALFLFVFAILLQAVVPPVFAEDLALDPRCVLVTELPNHAIYGETITGKLSLKNTTTEVVYITSTVSTDLGFWNPLGITTVLYPGYPPVVLDFVSNVSNRRGGEIRVTVQVKGESRPCAEMKTPVTVDVLYPIVFFDGRDKLEIIADMNANLVRVGKTSAVFIDFPDHNWEANISLGRPLQKRISVRQRVGRKYTGAFYNIALSKQDRWYDDDLVKVEGLWIYNYPNVGVVKLPLGAMSTPEGTVGLYSVSGQGYLVWPKNGYKLYYFDWYGWRLWDIGIPDFYNGMLFALVPES